jgi:arylsulfatase A-like enzyme
LAHSGSILANRPTIGAWVSYGLGTENENLPAFIVLSPNPDGGSLWRAGFLPSEYQGVPFNSSESDPEKMIRDLRNRQMDPRQQRRQLDLIQSMNRDYSNSWGADSFLEGRIKAMESAYRVQFEALDVFDVRKEPEAIRAEYGDNSWGTSCLLARRLVERGVRYVHLYPGAGWDDHKDIVNNLRTRCPNMDRAAGTLIRDLKRRGLLDETLVVWGGEFGRTPVSEGGDGRDHDPYGYTMLLAGGGVKGGIAYGATDEFGFKAVENRVSIHDLHATILHLLGIDHEKLTYRYAGRDFRLTDVYGEVVKDVIA